MGTTTFPTERDPERLVRELAERIKETLAPHPETGRCEGIGVVVPGIIMVGLMVIPYIDTNPRGVGVYNFKDRKFSVSIFLIGYALWFILIVIGEFFRGPNWHFYWPWESWETEKLAEQQLANIPHPFGYVLMAAYVALGFLRLPVLIRQGRHKEPGFLLRYFTTVVLMLMMFGVMVKIVLRLFFHVKYIIVTPYFSI